MVPQSVHSYEPQWRVYPEIVDLQQTSSHLTSSRSNILHTARGLNSNTWVVNAKCQDLSLPVLFSQACKRSTIPVIPHPGDVQMAQSPSSAPGISSLGFIACGQSSSISSLISIFSLYGIKLSIFEERWCQFLAISGHVFKVLSAGIDSFV